MEKIIKNCIHCGESFLGSLLSKFCSKKHKTAYHRYLAKKEIPPNNCLECGAVVTGKNKKKFCCNKHKEIYHRKRRRKGSPIETKKCLYCGGEFLPKKDNKNLKYCCRNHRIEYYYILRRKNKGILLESGFPAGKAEKKICYFCTGEFRSNKKNKFCCDEHRAGFIKAKRSKKPIMVKINSKLTIRTNKYDKILEILKKYTDHSEDISSKTSSLPSIY